MRVAVILPADHMDTDAYEQVRRELHGHDAATELLTADGDPSVGADGAVFPVDGAVQDIDTAAYDLFVVVGSAGARCYFEDQGLERFLAGVVAGEDPLLVVHDAVTMLAEMGILEEMTVAVPHADMERVRQRVGEVMDADHARCGPVVTVAGPAGIPGAVDAAVELTAR